MPPTARGDEATTGEQQDEAFHGGRPTDSPASLRLRDYTQKLNLSLNGWVVGQFDYDRSSFN
jgi:hypothetical protein